MDEILNKQIYEFSIVIRELRIQYHYTQKYVASQLGISYQSYQAYELGLTLPSLQNFLKLAKLYDVSLDYLVGNKQY